MTGHDHFEEHQGEHGHSSDQPASSMDFSTDLELGMSVGGGSGRKLDRNTVALAVIILAAIIGLWSMRTLTPTSADTAQIGDVPPAHIVVDSLDANVIDRLVIQSPASSMYREDRDPFHIWQPADGMDQNALKNEFSSDGSVDRDRSCAEWRTEVDRVAGLLSLKSVLGGGTVRAIVNIEGVLLAMGETFDIENTEIEFSVEGTGRRSVRLGSYNVHLDCWHEVEIAMGGDR